MNAVFTETRIQPEADEPEDQLWYLSLIHISEPTRPY